MKNKKTFSLKSAFLPAVLALGGSGCATLPSEPEDSCVEGITTTFLFGLVGSNQRHYNEDCALHRHAMEMIRSDDMGVRAVGHALIEGKNDQTRDVGDIVRDVMVRESTGPMQCEVEKVEEAKDGERVIRLGNCRPAP